MNKALPQSPVRCPSPFPVRLPSYRASRFEDASFWLLGIATFCSVALFLTSIAQFAGQADQFVARIQAPRHTLQESGLAGSTPNTNRSTALRVLLAPATANPATLPAMVQPVNAPEATRSDI